MKHRVGRGILDRVIDRLPVEIHLPGYQFCGPGTNLNVRLARGDRGINLLDAACKEHDLAYRRSKQRRVADQILLTKALHRVTSADASVGERLAALIVAGAMKGKLAIGGGVGGGGKRIAR